MRMRTPKRPDDLQKLFVHPSCHSLRFAGLSLASRAIDAESRAVHMKKKQSASYTFTNEVL